MKTLLLTGAALAGLLGPGCGRSTCVARGTRIRRRDGEVAVEQISIGDEVLCLDPATGERAYGRVSALTVGRRECIDLVFGSRTLTVTTDHPLYCPDTSQWADAGDWALGKRHNLLVVTAETTEPVRVEETSYSGVQEVFDVSVDHPFHDFVANGVLVHNKRQVPGPDCPAMVCGLPDGGEVLAGEPCACPLDAGTITCASQGEPAQCAPCETEDESDGGTDGG